MDSPTNYPARKSGQNLAAMRLEGNRQGIAEAAGDSPGAIERAARQTPLQPAPRAACDLPLDLLKDHAHFCFVEGTQSFGADVAHLAGRVDACHHRLLITPLNDRYQVVVPWVQ
jgi:hypothetical protein